MSTTYTYAFIDETSKRELRRKLLKAIAIPGYQVPFASRDMPIARGWGTGGLQITLASIGTDDTIKVIDQGADDSVNAVNIKRFLQKVALVDTTTDTQSASLIQTRHRIPEEALNEGQTMIYQVPLPDPLRYVEGGSEKARRMHAEGNYSAMWLYLYEDIVKFKEISIGSCYPVIVNDRYIMDPSPIPRWDVPRLHQSSALHLFGAGTEKRVYAVPPYTDVKPLEFEDYAFEVENFNSLSCEKCGAQDVFLDEVIDSKTGEHHFTCSDTSFCNKNLQIEKQPKTERSELLSVVSE